ncbi:2Fe-2S iron-sulfur cluster-binding protein [Marinobacterium aestuariivivens]|uniref:2Fe-2S iron-sulfur cluster-binding protein n=1 Tax=Marinobacterium aestuariivivens TaxID=1698799 RepID=A0ABW2A3G2_9GAMM
MPDGETILQALQRAGLDAPSSCEEGFCGACMATLEEG